MPPFIDNMWHSLQQTLESVGMLGASALVMIVGISILFLGLRRP